MFCALEKYSVVTEQQSDSKFWHSLQLTSTVCVEMAELLNPPEDNNE